MAQIFSYNTTAALPCRSCGGGFKESDNVVMFHNRRFHARCYYCHGCKKQFEVPTQENAKTNQPCEVRDLPYCPGACFKEANKERCAGCQKELSPFEPFLRPKNLHKKYHKDCFRCTKCQHPMHTGFGMRWDHPYCPSCLRSPLDPPPGVQV
uniref:LIM zinc-binding domain-containing protein n=2 Tax=Vannella robusta TaxID=1487602 RepID=A0A7S4II81_9EUKA|mmetsp:Transcript_286/g.360  ORF Transcript_286/g.360 Transcript_286/m.360 type:complete len:152 (+) Transcript_286:245-700(+)